MGTTLRDIAQQLKDKNKKVQLIYAFNGIGKTRLSREFQSLVTIKSDDELNEEEVLNRKILYYNALTEDLFYWDNDLKYNLEPKLKIFPNSFTKWIFNEQGQDKNVIKYFNHFTNQSLTPRFSPNFTEVTFSYMHGNATIEPIIKISKGEESCFVWSVFYSFLQQVIEVLDVVEPMNRETNQFDELEYIFIDDPVTSLDDNHLIQLAVDLAKTIRDSNLEIKFIITTHNPVFYNVLHSELKNKSCYMLDRLENGTFKLVEKHGDSNSSFSYHLHLKKTLEEAIRNNKIEKYHFTLLRNLYEKTASFLGYKDWSELLPDYKDNYYKRIMHFSSHSKLSDLIVAQPSKEEKQTVEFLLNHLNHNYNFYENENKTDH